MFISGEWFHYVDPGNKKGGVKTSQIVTLRFSRSHVRHESCRFQKGSRTASEFWCDRYLEKLSNLSKLREKHAFSRKWVIVTACSAIVWLTSANACKLWRQICTPSHHLLRFTIGQGPHNSLSWRTRALGLILRTVPFTLHRRFQKTLPLLFYTKMIPGVPFQSNKNFSFIFLHCLPPNYFCDVWNWSYSFSQSNLTTQNIQNAYEYKET